MFNRISQSIQFNQKRKQQKGNLGVINIFIHKFITKLRNILSVKLNYTHITKIPIGISYDETMLYLAYGNNYICYDKIPLQPVNTLKERFEVSLQGLSLSSHRYKVISGIPPNITWHYEKLSPHKKQPKECFALVSQILDQHLPINKNQTYFDFSQTALSSQTNSPYLLQVIASKKNELEQYLAPLKTLHIHQVESQILALLRAFEYATQEPSKPHCLYIYQDQRQSIALCWHKNSLLSLQFKVDESIAAILERFISHDEIKLESCVHYYFHQNKLSKELTFPEQYQNSINYKPIPSALYPYFISLGHLVGAEEVIHLKGNKERTNRKKSEDEKEQLKGVDSYA